MKEQKRRPPIRQSEGVNISGGKNLIRGDVVGHDKLIISQPTSLSMREIGDLFAPLVQQLEQAPPEHRQLVLSQAEALKAEVAKGKQAEDKLMAKLIDGIVALVPNAVSTLGGIFATPILSGIAGSATGYVLDKLRGN